MPRRAVFGHPRERLLGVLRRDAEMKAAWKPLSKWRLAACLSVVSL